jgi:hypothetical protein
MERTGGANRWSVRVERTGGCIAARHHACGWRCEFFNMVTTFVRSLTRARMLGTAPRLLRTGCSSSTSSSASIPPSAGGLGQFHLVRRRQEYPGLDGNQSKKIQQSTTDESRAAGMSFFVIHRFHSGLSPWRAGSRGSGGGRSDRVSPPLSALYFSFLFEFSLVIKLHAPNNRIYIKSPTIADDKGCERVSAECRLPPECYQSEH